MEKKQINRREFIKGTAAVAGAALISQYAKGTEETASVSVKKTAVDQVTLGKTGIKLSRLGVGTGTNSGNLQRGLGREGFNNLIKYAYDQGITYFDTAEAYQTHPFVGEAIKSLPREKLFIQSKMMVMSGFGRGGMGGFGGFGGYGGGMNRRGRGDGFPNAPAEQPKTLEKIEGFLKELGVEYIDSLLIHCQTAENWDETNKQLMEDLDKAKEKGYIRSHGVSCHSLAATTKAASLDWVDVNLVRINPQGVNVDSASTAVFGPSSESNVPPIVEQLKIMRKNGHGIIGMKLIGEGVFTDIAQRKKSLTWVMQQDIVDAVVIGMKSKEEIDENIKHINEAFVEKA